MHTALLLDNRIALEKRDYLQENVIEYYKFISYEIEFKVCLNSEHGTLS